MTSENIFVRLRITWNILLFSQIFTYFITTVQISFKFIYVFESIKQNTFKNVKRAQTEMPDLNP